MYLKKHEKVTDNPSVRIYINKIENRIKFKIETRYYLELLTPETINYFEVLKLRYLKIKMVEMHLNYKLLN